MSLSHTPDPFDVRQLRILTMLASERSLSAAARKLHLTQSAISHSLRKLEQDAGVRLVERNERGAELTQAGQVLAKRAQTVFNEMQEARDDLQQLQNWGNQRLRLGASTTACQYLLPTLLSKFRDKHPRCHIEVSSGNTLARLTQLRDGRIDVAIVTHTSLHAPDLEIVKMGSESLCLIRPAKETTGAETYIGYERSSSLAHDALLWFDGAQLPRPRPAMELESLEAIKALVKAGLGYAVVPEWVVRPELASAQLSAERGPQPVSREWSVVTRKGHQTTLSEAEWIRLLTTNGPKLLG
jgi:LysR family transcriptional regulator, low CO2-responsive transcriptional regulator